MTCFFNFFLLSVVDRTPKGDSAAAVDDDAPAGVTLGTSSTSRHSTTPFDAANVDVFSGAHAAVVLFDVRSATSWAYVQRLLPRIPPDVSVMVLANFRDMLQKGAAAPISLRAAQAEVEALSLQRQSKHPVHVFETSLLDCFGQSQRAQRPSSHTYFMFLSPRS